MRNLIGKTIKAFVLLNFYEFAAVDGERTELDFNYHKYDAMTKFMKNFVSSHPELAQLKDIGKSPRKKSLWVMKLGVNSTEKNKANIKLVGNIHGNEAVGREVLLHFIDYIGEHYKSDEKIKHLLKYNVIHILPSMNPDSFEVSKVECESNNGRKNIKDVDLNRNFPDYYEKNDWPPRQPETKAVMRWMRETNFILSASLHGGALVANYPFDNTKEKLSFPQQEESKTPDDAVFKHLALTYSKNHPEMHQGHSCESGDKIKFKDGITNGAAWYSFTGGMQDYNYAFRGCMEVTLEISCCKYPQVSKLEGLWKQNIKPLVEYCLQAGMGVKGIVQDISTNKTITNANLTVEGIDMNFYTDKNGTFFRILLPGKYTLKVSAINYKTMRKSFTVENTTGNPIMTAIAVYLIQGNDSNTDYPETEQTSIVTDYIQETTSAYNFNTPNDQAFINTEKLPPQMNSRFDYEYGDEFLSNGQKKNFNLLLLLFIIFIRMTILK